PVGRRARGRRTERPDADVRGERHRPLALAPSLPLTALIAAVVLAAGASTRFGSPKQRLLLEPVLERVRASGVDELVVVLRAYEVSSSERVVRCPDWEVGPGASLRCGLRALGPDVEAAVV